MEKTYDPKCIEPKWYPAWEKAGHFSPKLEHAAAQPAYCIMLPPPNVTGTLHMGHGFQVSLMDALIRHQRMLGNTTLWQAGTDHAGIATQMVVERKLLQENISRHALGREAFLEKVWQWKGQSDGAIKGQLRRMGASLDWTRERFSLDQDINRAVLKVFVDLYDQGLLYRGKRLVNWDPVLLTAISDLEVITQEEDSFLWHLRYPIVGSTEVIVVATTRPETMLGDTAVAVHPEDPRYQHLIGKYIQLPLTDRTIPIIADDYVEQAFGTGCVKITPAHDFNDYAIGQRHNLPLLNILTPDAHLNDTVPAAYCGLTREQARERIVQDLTRLELIEKIEPYKRQTPRGDRSGAIIEPYLTDQWYIKAQPLAEPAIAAVKNGEIQFVPENWNKTYFLWLENIQDWCISRQLWWGHRIPAWYDEKGNVYVAETESAVRSKYHLSAEVILHQDEDVLDTWFSASLWPFATLGWPESTPEFKTFYPTNVLVTGFDILFFWVARMVMMGLKFTGKVPFSTVYVTGLIRDSEGQKMSKSKGNILDPIDLIDGIDLESLVVKRTQGLMQPDKAKKIEKATRKEFPNGIAAFGTDALRFTFCALANTGRDIRFDLGRIEGYRNFCNKLWNAARYVLMNTEDHLPVSAEKNIEFGLAERWIQSQLQATIQNVTQAFAHYRFDLLAQTLYEFVWNAYCDWYLEFSKPILTGADTNAAQQLGTRKTLVEVLETVLRLMHPLMPFITEEIWQAIAKLTGKSQQTLMLQPYPQYNPAQLDVAADAEIEWLKKIILSIRQIRGEMNISPNKTLVLLLKNGSAKDKLSLQRNESFLQKLAKLDSISWLQEGEEPPPAASAVVEQLELFIPLAGVIDIQAEKNRLQKEIDKLQVELFRIQQRLNNAHYVEKAPAAVVEKERVKAAELQEVLEKLQLQQHRWN